MDRRFSWVFLLASGVFFFFVVGLTGYRIQDARQRNADDARSQLPDLVQKADSLRTVTGGYDAPQFRKGMRSLFDAQPRLLLLSIHSPDGILYLVTRDKSLLQSPTEVSPSWRGTPAYNVSRGYQILLSTAVDGSPVVMDTLSLIMGREDLYPIVRDDLYLFLAFLLICGVLMLIVFGVQQEPVTGRADSAPAPAPAPAPAAAPTPAPAPPPAPAPAPAAAPAPAPAAMAVPAPAAPAAAVTASSAAAATTRPLTSPTTGLVWSDHLQERLSGEIERAAAGDQDIACGRVKIDGPLVAPTLYGEVARAIKATFAQQDLLFESGEGSYTVVLPDTGLDSAVRLFEELRRKVSQDAGQRRTPTLSIGVSSRGGRLIDHPTLLEEAGTAMAKASREGGNQVIGFRADAARYRDALTGAAT